MTEDDFSDAIVDLARTFGWLAVAVRPCRSNKGWRTAWRYDGKGFPDLTLVNAERSLVVLAELKIPPNKLSLEQETWRTELEILESNGDGYVRYFIWTPADADAIASLVSNGRVTDWRLAS